MCSAILRARSTITQQRCNAIRTILIHTVVVGWPMPCLSNSSLPRRTARAYADRGYVRIHQDDYTGAIEDCTQAITLEPDNWRHYDCRGNAHAFLGDGPRALADYDRALELNESDPYVWHGRGFVREKAGDRAGARADYQRAADLYRQLGDMAEYEDMQRRLKALQP
jgi:Flp pilus assembly protein TadD